MQFDILYRIDTTRHGGGLCGESNLFPVLKINYRKKGSRRWTCLGMAEIDLYTYLRFKNTYYRDFEKNTTAIMTLESKSDYDRLMLFMDIIKAEFDGKIEKFIENIVREEITMTMVDIEERKETGNITRSLATNGWTQIDAEV